MATITAYARELSVVGSNITWTDQQNLVDENDSTAASAIVASRQSGDFMIGNFDFTAIPKGAIIQSVALKTYTSLPKYVKFLIISCRKYANGEYTSQGTSYNESISSGNETKEFTWTSRIGTWTRDELAITPQSGVKNGPWFYVRFANATSPDRTVTTNYFKFVVEYTIPTYTITVSAGTGGTVSGGGSYESGTTATLTATPNTGYKFKQWSDGNTSNPRTVTVTADATYTAQFEKLTYSVSVAANPTDGGTVTGGGTYEHGSNATLTASAFGDYKFKQWSDGNTENPRTVAVLANATYTAEFEVITYTVSVSASPTEGGTVTGGGVYESSKVAYLEAIPNEGYKFVGWSNGLSGSLVSIRVYEDVNLVAYFEKEPTSNILAGTQRVTAYCGTQKIPVYCGTKKI